MKTLADFKRRIQLGVKLETSYPNGLQIPAREVSIRQSNSFALKTTKTDGKVVDSWMQWPKAKFIEFPSPNEARILWDDRDGNITECLTYKFID